MNNISDIGFVDPHSERIGRNDTGQSARHEIFLYSPALVGF